MKLRNCLAAATALTVTPGAADGQDICDFLEIDDCAVSGNTIAGGNGTLRRLTARANLWVDIPTAGGAGIGGYEVDGEGKAHFAWQLGAGIAFAVLPAVAPTLDYRHRRIGGATIVDEDDSNYATKVGKVKTDSIGAGLRFRFRPDRPWATAPCSRQSASGATSRDRSRHRVVFDQFRSRVMPDRSRHPPSNKPGPSRHCGCRNRSGMTEMNEADRFRPWVLPTPR